MGTLDGMSAVIAGGPAAGGLIPPLGCVLCMEKLVSTIGDFVIIVNDF